MAYYSTERKEAPILEIQQILRNIEYFENGRSPIRLTGTYNEETRQGVGRFQEKYGLPVTGNVDSATWLVLQAVDRSTRDAQALARAVYLLPRDPEYAIYPGTRDDAVYIIQHMINVVSQEYDAIPPLEFSGIYDEATENAVKEFQRINLLESSGILDNNTFNRLADEYERINSYNQ